MRSSLKYSQLILVLAAFLFAATPLFAQSNFGSMRGIVTDPQGAAISDATVTLTDQATKISRKTISNHSGEYVFSAVPPGTYSVSVSINGFSPKERTGLRVDAGNTLTIDVGLALGGTNQTVEVSATEPLVDNGTSYNGQLIDAQKLQNLPNPGRNPFLFSKLDNNVTPVGDPRFVRFQDQSGSSTISIAGGPLASNNYAVDGIPITDFSNRAVIIPSLEAVEEVKVQANTYDAEVGRTSGGMFNTTLRSGSTSLHGVLQGQTRQTNWGANTFFNNHHAGTAADPTVPRGAAEYYTWVGAIGGPIPLPSWLGGKDKTFFWLTEEGYRQRSPYVNTTQFKVPTAKQRTGDFSELGTVAGGVCVSGRCIYDPTSATRTPFPGNIIPTNRINAVGQSILNAYPLPNTPDTTYGATNFNGGDTLGDRADEFIGKLTHQFGTRWLADFYYMHYGSKEPGGNPLQNFAGSSNSYLLYRKVDAVGIQNTITLNPTTVLTVGFGFNRFPNNTADISAGFDQSTLGSGSNRLPAYYLAALSKSGFPRIVGDTGLTSEGTSNSGIANYFSRNFVVGIAKSLGKHSVKVGYVFREISLSYTSLSDTNGNFNFDNTLTSVSSTDTSNSGATAADVLLGYPTSGQLIIPTPLAITTGYNAVYLQDDYRLNSKLTINLGVRFEHERGVHERNNNYAVGFDRSVKYTVAGSTVPAVGGVMFAGINGAPTYTGNTPNKVSPRIGAAYSIDSKTVVRGGFGVFYQPLTYSNSSGFAPGYVLTNSIATQIGVPTASLYDPFPGSSFKTTPTGNALGYSTNVGSTLTVIDQARKAPFYESWSFGVDRELPAGFAFKLGYVGGHARNQPNSININQLQDQYYSLGVSQLGQATTFAYSGVGQWPSKTQPYNVTIRPFPQFQSITNTVSVGYSNYHAMDIKVQKRFEKGLTVLTAFTWASNWDNLWSASGSSLNSGNNGPQDIYNPKAEYSRSLNDMPKRWTMAVTYELPFGRGKMFGSGANRFMDLLIGGWKLNDITIMQDGSPLAITQANNLSAYGNSTQRPTRVPGVQACYSGRPEDRLGGAGNKPYFNIAAWTVTQAPSYGNSTRTVNCYGPGYVNSDISVYKTFSVTERIKAEFRAEALNAFNTPEFSTPSLAINPNTPNSVGQISGTLGFPRLIGLGGRITF